MQFYRLPRIGSHSDARRYFAFRNRTPVNTRHARRGLSEPFAHRHPEVFTISPHNVKNYSSEGLCMLSPTVAIYPLPSVSNSSCLFSMMLVLVPDVPRTRSGAGSKLKGLGVQNASKIRRVSLQPKDFGSLVDVFVYRRTLINLRERAVRR